MYVFIVGMERCGTHSLVSIINNGCIMPHHVVHEEQPFLCKEAKLLFEGNDFRTENLKEKVQLWRKHHKHKALVCEANHRFGYFITFLARQFPGCKIIFLYRDPFDTIVSRIGIWSYYPDFLDRYPDFFKKIVAGLTPPYDFNDYRISPPLDYPFRSIVELYAWEWIENYKFVRKELSCIPPSERFIMMTENITQDFRKVFKFINEDFFYINEELLAWSRLKSDSIYIQQKEHETDVFITRNRDPLTDQTVLFAKYEVYKNRDIIKSIISKGLKNISVDMENDLVNMDKQVKRLLEVKMT